MRKVPPLYNDEFFLFFSELLDPLEVLVEYKEF